MANVETGQDSLVDARGLMCPEPLLRVRGVLESLPAGAIVRVLATDPHASLDFHAYCMRTGHVLLEESEDTGIYRLRIRKKQ